MAPGESLILLVRRCRAPHAVSRPQHTTETEFNAALTPCQTFFGKLGNLAEPGKKTQRQWFNIGGNKYRPIAAIHFDRGRLFIRHVLTHAEYDEGKWKEY